MFFVVTVVVARMVVVFVRVVELIMMMQAK